MPYLKFQYNIKHISLNVIFEYLFEIKYQIETMDKGVGVSIYGKTFPYNKTTYVSVYFYRFQSNVIGTAYNEETINLIEKPKLHFNILC